jgi:cysteine desulfurase
LIYFDNSATTRPYKEVVETFQEVTTNYFGNPSSIHSLGQQAEKLIQKSRQIVADILNVRDEEVFFTSGGTEGNNIAIKGCALQYKSRGNHIITSKTEHASVIETCKQLESFGFDVTYLDVNNEGQVSIEDLKNSIKDSTILVSLMHVNNEVGTVQPIMEIGNYLNQFPKIIFHVDNVQGIGKVPLNLRKANIDLCTLSGHKFHGIKGSGVLFVKNGIKLEPLITGGMQEGKIRSGTENVAGIVSLAKALRVSNEKYTMHVEQLQEMKNELVKYLSSCEDVIINTPIMNSAPHIINFSLPGIKPEAFVHELGKNKVYVSTRSACSSKKADVSHVLSSMGFDKTISGSSIRISLSYGNSYEEIIKFKEIFNNSLKQFKQLMR